MKKLFVLCLALLFLHATPVFAHSKLTTSSPEKNETLEQSPAQFVMEFNTDIASLSTFIVENEAGDSIALDQIKAEASKLSGIPISPLENGSYNVTWTIIGADGHTVSGTYSFRVNASEVTPEPTIEEPQATPVPTPSVEPSPTPETNNTDNVTEEAEKNSPLIPIVLIIIIIALAAIFAINRKKK